MLDILTLAGDMFNNSYYVWKELYRSLFKENKSELKLQEIIHLQNVANYLPDVFADPIF